MQESRDQTVIAVETEPCHVIIIKIDAVYFYPANVSKIPLWNIRFFVGMATAEVARASRMWVGSERSVERGVSWRTHIMTSCDVIRVHVLCGRI